MLRPVVVELDRQLRALDAERGEQLGARSANGSTVGIGCSIQPKTIRAPSRSSSTGTMPAPRLEPDHVELQRPAEHEGRAEHRVAGERQLGRRREDPDPHVPVRLAAGSTNTVSEKFISRASGCSVLVGELARVGEDGELVARRAARSVKTSATT